LGMSIDDGCLLQMFPQLRMCFVEYLSQKLAKRPKKAIME
jgi:hypothetical protein